MDISRVIATLSSGMLMAAMIVIFTAQQIRREVDRERRRGAEQLAKVRSCAERAQERLLSESIKCARLEGEIETIRAYRKGYVDGRNDPKNAAEQLMDTLTDGEGGSFTIRGARRKAAEGGLQDHVNRSDAAKGAAAQ